MMIMSVFLPGKVIVSCPKSPVLFFLIVTGTK
jgi:hypothetical protein